jgi:hypothetical protein
MKATALLVQELVGATCDNTSEKKNWYWILKKVIAEGKVVDMM